MLLNLSYVQSIFLVFLSAAVHSARSLDYSELEALGVSCPERDKCAGYRHDRSYVDRNCECDSACMTYRDCCIDFNRRRHSGRSATQTTAVCLHYGHDEYTGVYAVAHCSSSWTGPQQVRQKCEGSPDFSDPMSAAPVTSVAQAKTYKNLFCAECNNANMESLKTFHFKLSCEGLDISPEQLMGDLFYNQEIASWGVNRLNAEGDPTFVDCEIIFDVPEYINSSIRFCRANVISRCATDWTRQLVRTKCAEYMAVVYDATKAYKNPHCAICNHKTVADLACRTSLLSRRRPMSFALLLDVNQGDGDQVGMTQVATPECPSGHKYDPFFKRCRKLVCALPGHEVVNGRCAPSG